MKVLSIRRIVAACIVSSAMGVALAAPGAASAEPVSEQCSGETPIKGRGSTFQDAAEKVWDPQFNEIAGKPNKNVAACGGTQGGKKKIKVEYLETEKEDRGSGACLKAFGAGLKGTEKAKFGRYAFCGTDEAPNAAQRKEMESHKEGAENESIESVPVATGAEAVMVHLPEKCVASSAVTGATNRLVLKAQTLEGIYRGTITKWSQITDNGDALSGAGCNPEEEIKRVVRLDKSGTTHIFKEFLAQASENTKLEEVTFEAEEFGEIESGKGDPCGSVLPPENKTWGQVASGCENQRWPKGTKAVVRPVNSGNQGVIETVNADPSSIGYGDLAQIRPSFGAGAGTEKFWVEVQHNFEPKKPTTAATYADPSTNGELATVAESNCAGSLFTNGKEKFPPKSTRALWNAVRAKVKEAKYAICGLTYDLILDEGSKYTKETESPLTLGGATSAVDFELWVNNGAAGGGGNVIKKQDYQPLPDTIADKAEEGLKEVVF
jgi:ABC-type phosphate transport system substrate-binding protein